MSLNVDSFYQWKKSFSSKVFMPCVNLSGGGRDWLTQKFSALELALISRRGERNVQLAVYYCATLQWMKFHASNEIHAQQNGAACERGLHTRGVYFYTKNWPMPAAGPSHYTLQFRYYLLRFAASSWATSDVTAAIFALFARALRFLRQPRNYIGWAHCSLARYREARKLTPLTRQQSWKLRVSVTEPEGSGRF